MNQAIIESKLDLEGQKDVYRGKVRDVYNLEDKYLLMLATDRISAFDVVLPRGIPYKGQVLNQIAAKSLDATEDIVPNWKIAVPDPMVTFGRKCEPFMVEMVIRGYLTGHAWREYRSGKREICGETLPEGMKENQKFDKPIITPTTKALEGHDEDISKDEIIANDLVSKQDYEKLEKYTYALFERGTQMAEDKGLILVDTKYEFGIFDNKIYLIDEIHTPDSSRYFYLDEYRERFEKGLPQKQLSKEFVREWLMEKGFHGKEGQQIPEMTDEFVNQVSERYIELYEKITGEKFEKADVSDVPSRVENNVKRFWEAYNR
ncbi:MAG: phosphoribosylaminoimidazolesuccinocarboxamide synthase [Bacteroidales bacterium]|nr:phosphoribosylaminoimidazolesuccinocarboxamide synthase [Bacteroidales bacterium]